jgi:AcrR family transcriptional regulator
VAQVRPYRGIDAAERLAQRRGKLLAAGLDLLGSPDQDLNELTVRAICKQAGLGLRYFYESFTDKDDLVAAVFDSVIADIAATTQAAVAAAPIKEQSRAGMANVVMAVAGDARVGRLLFSTALSNAVIVRKREDSTALFAALLFQHAGAMGATASERIKATSHFVVGGVGQMISAWLSGDVALEPDRLIDQLALIIDRLTDPKLG